LTRLLPAGIELAGYALIGVCLYLIEPLLLLGAGGLGLVGIGIALSRALEKPE
jgi:hypothetical protein